MTSIGYELIVISACVLGAFRSKAVSEKSHMSSQGVDFGDGRERDEPAEYLSIRTVCGTRFDPAGGGDLRPLQTKAKRTV